MKHFYHFLKNGLDKDEALRQAKLSYLDQCRDIQSTPYHWASFLQIGDSRALEFQEAPNYKNHWYLGIGFVLVLFFVVVFYSKYKI